MTGKTKREPPLSILLPFDETIRRALKVKPPPEGWAEFERQAKKKRASKAKRRKRAA